MGKQIHDKISSNCVNKIFAWECKHGCSFPTHFCITILDDIYKDNFTFRQVSSEVFWICQTVRSFFSIFSIRDCNSSQVFCWNVDFKSTEWFNNYRVVLQHPICKNGNYSQAVWFPKASCLPSYPVPSYPPFISHLHRNVTNRMRCRHLFQGHTSPRGGVSRLVWKSSPSRRAGCIDAQARGSEVLSLNFFALDVFKRHCCGTSRRAPSTHWWWWCWWYTSAECTLKVAEAVGEVVVVATLAHYNSLEVQHLGLWNAAVAAWEPRSIFF